jgi:hypothetical protein
MKIEFKFWPFNVDILGLQNIQSYKINWLYGTLLNIVLKRFVLNFCVKFLYRLKTNQHLLLLVYVIVYDGKLHRCGSG